MKELVTAIDCDDVLIDRYLGHGRSALEFGLQKVILFGDYPWNHGAVPDRTVRCVGWNEVHRAVGQYASGE